jgi:RNA polymerase sigma-70 factor, ECF subfamily
VTFADLARITGQEAAVSTHDKFQDLLEQHKRLLYKVCRTFGREPADRDDLAQEITAQLWRAFPSFDDRAAFSTWMYRIALNIAISFQRRERTRTRYVISDDDLLLEVADDRAPSELAHLFALIDRLAPLDKALLLLYLDGHNHRQIGEVLGISEHNVATKLNRLKQAMRADAESGAQRRLR